MLALRAFGWERRRHTTEAPPSPAVTPRSTSLARGHEHGRASRRHRAGDRACRGRAVADRFARLRTARSRRRALRARARTRAARGFRPASVVRTAAPVRAAGTGGAHVGHDLSRVQFAVRAFSNGLIARLEVENVGRARLLHNGRRRSAPNCYRATRCSSAAACCSCACEGPSNCRRRQPRTDGRFRRAGRIRHRRRVTCDRKLRQQLAYVAERPGHVLLLGASGTRQGARGARGARAVARAGRGKMVARNAATIPEGLADAELFGNAKNYPNPGMPERAGLVGEADGSTLFLDEIGELSDAPAGAAAARARRRRVPAGSARRTRAGASISGCVAATNRPESALKPDVLARFRFRIELPDSACAARTSRCSRAICCTTPPDADARISCELMAQCLRRPFATNVRELATWLSEAMSGSAGQSPILGRTLPSEPPPSASIYTRERPRARGRRRGRARPRRDPGRARPEQTACSRRPGARSASRTATCCRV